MVQSLENLNHWTEALFKQVSLFMRKALTENSNCCQLIFFYWKNQLKDLLNKTLNDVLVKGISVAGITCTLLSLYCTFLFFIVYNVALKEHNFIPYFLP